MLAGYFLRSEKMTYEEMCLQFPDAVKNHEKRAQKEQSQSDFDLSRMGMFTASEIWKLLTTKFEIAQNDTSRNYIYEKAFERATGIRAAQGFKADATDWGNDNEGSAVQSYMDLTGNIVHHWGDNQKFFKHARYDVGAFPDGRILPNAVLEAKCPFNGGQHMQNLACGQSITDFKKLRFKYYAQMQVQIWVTESDYAHFFSFRPDAQNIPKSYLLEIPRDESFLVKLEEIIIVAQSERDRIIKNINS
jgi:hypothetical protein